MIFDDNNNEILSFLSMHNIKSNKLRKIISICSIILITILFSGLATIILGVYKSAEKSAMYQQGKASNVTIENITRSNFDELKKDSIIKRLGFEIDIGFIETGEGTYKVINCDEEYAKLNFLLPLEGNMPLDENDIVLSDSILSEMGHDYTIGEKIRLNISTTDHKEYLRELNLCGIYNDEYGFIHNIAIVSEKFLSHNFEDNKLNSVDIEFYNSFNIDKKVDKLLRNYSIDNSARTINWSYDYVSCSEVYFQIFIIVIIIEIIGYSIMNNIISISINSDIKFYGYLKLLGATNKQIKKIIYKQYILLSLIGIPVGSVLGYIIGNILLTMINVVILDNLVLYKETALSFNIFIFIVSCVLSLLTMFFSGKESINFILDFNPLQYFYYNNLLDNDTSERVKSNNISLIKMLERKKKIILVTFSLASGLVLFNTLFNILYDFNMDDYITENSMCEQSDKYSIYESDNNNYERNVVFKYAKLKKSYVVVGSTIIFVVELIGILNYINFHISRKSETKNELILLECIGMTNSQIVKVMILKGIGCGGISVIFAILGSAIIKRVLFTEIKEYFIFTPILITAPIIFFICIMVPVIIYSDIFNRYEYDRLKEL